MKRAEKTEISLSLDLIAGQAEELHARLFEAFPAHAATFQKIAAHCRNLNTCLRVHDTLPEKKPGPALVEAAKAATELQRGFQKITRLIPKG